MSHSLQPLSLLSRPSLSYGISEALGASFRREFSSIVVVCHAHQNLVGLQACLSSGMPTGLRASNGSYFLSGRRSTVCKQTVIIRMCRLKLPLGDVVYLNVFGQPFLVLNSHKTTADLLDRRAAIYSDRPHYIVAGDILTGGLFLVFLGYNET
jgi:hypothetical protein